MSDGADAIVVLCGGVGAARFLDGLVRVVDPASVTAIVNVADDAEFHGLHVSPDIDTVLYTLAGLVDAERGWGIRGDTFRGLAALERYRRDTWFLLGDEDLATHIRRTELLRSGMPLSAVTDELRRALGIGARIVPATDARQSTRVRTPDGWLAFQEYFVRRRAADIVLEVRIDGGGMAAVGVLEAVESAAVVIVAPSNPIVSIGPILEVEGFREALRRRARPVVAVTPIVRGAAIKGPAAEMLRGLGHDVSAVGVARLYADFLDVMVLDERDADLAALVAKTGIRPVLAQTIMRDADAKEGLARAVLAAASWRGAR
ncbi:MAG TPA: 2-phospho-L-lactate transferase [Candidatus Limnocylindria bacterium]|nr:2-phospho-L-lactate transferase [Candidatus Limnocylindria bacterium]